MFDPLVRYECAVDGCDWTLDVNGPEATGALMPGATISQSIELTVREVAMMRARVVEAGLREHMEGHTAEEYLRTIVRLQGELRDRRSAGGE